MVAVVSSAIIDRVSARLDRRLYEVPVGFKWFVDGLLDGSLGIGGEESAGASFLRIDGSAWTTDKDGIVPGLLAAEMTARTGRDPALLYRDLARDLGAPATDRVEAPATRACLAGSEPTIDPHDGPTGHGRLQGKMPAKLIPAPGFSRQGTSPRRCAC